MRLPYTTGQSSSPGQWYSGRMVVIKSKNVISEIYACLRQASLLRPAVRRTRAVPFHNGHENALAQAAAECHSHLRGAAAVCSWGRLFHLELVGRDDPFHELDELRSKLPVRGGNRRHKDGLGEPLVFVVLLLRNFFR